MGKKNKNNKEKTTNNAGESQNLNDVSRGENNNKNMPAGTNKRGSQGSK